MKANQLKGFIKDERVAPLKYAKLIKQLDSPRDKKIVKGIIADERKHFFQLNQMKRRLK